MNKNYKKINFSTGINIDESVNLLLDYKRKGILACGDFNGITLHSDTVTLDMAYESITGKTKAELEKQRQNWKEEYDKREKEHKENIPTLIQEWINKGRDILTEDKWEYWNEIVPFRLNDLYHGMELGCCLDIVKILNGDGTLNEAKEMIESQNHSGMSYGLVCSMVEAFCERGKEFNDYVN